ncbi:MAG: hypothetical protein MI923_02145 [Phycisphaerales bacterium]|nr:hypothetical protein [Phycisphaerales bacterium]
MTVKKLLVCSMLALVVLAAPGMTKNAEAFISLPVLPPIQPSCGTVEIVDPVSPLPGLEDGCKVWRSDKNNGGLFIFAGLDAFEPGDRIFVTGDQCVFCIGVCPAVALLNATIDDCDPGPGPK